MKKALSLLPRPDSPALRGHTVVAGFLSLVIGLCGCKDDGLLTDPGMFQFAPRLSDYRIFSGNMKDLIPAENFTVYDLATELFSDYALKQRLIRLPRGQAMRENGGGLPDFPDSTVLVKTFYYRNDYRIDSSGHRIMETRLLVKEKNAWNVATYVWNESQTDAYLVTSGFNTIVNWINEQGDPEATVYHVPSARECVTCHSTGGDITPIGPKMRNLNRSVLRGGNEVSQLDYLSDLGLVSLSGMAINPLPASDNIAASPEERARAYVDVNCGHCHSRDGFADQSRLRLTFESTVGGGDLARRNRAVVEAMRRGRMPLIGTTMVHREGLALIEAYIKTL